jgi:translation initiation factor eIF-2B subunit alpha/methylthioribose-1-phosphate isomerase
MRYKNNEFRSVWLQNDKLFIIDQTLLPHRFAACELPDIQSVIMAIKTMQVRGAPAIGATAALAYALAVTGSDKADQKIYQNLLASRPTAVDLRNGLDFVRKAISHNPAQDDLRLIALKAASEFVEKNVHECRLIGEVGKKLIPNGCRILTHCNAGALATVDYGTALAPLRSAKKAGIDFFVFVDETRPRLQGTRLTAWELAQEAIEHALIVDSAAGYYMQQNKIDLVITGADRIARNGDIANKIGTYSKAVLAKENHIPFYIAAPFSTFDLNLNTGTEIQIEERHQDEVLQIHGYKLSGTDSPALNPAFDVTPAKYISGYITPAGIFQQKDFDKLWEIVIRVQNSPLN